MNEKWKDTTIDLLPDGVKRDNMNQNNTLGYYNNHANEFYKNTVDVEFATMQKTVFLPI